MAGDAFSINKSSDLTTFTIKVGGDELPGTYRVLSTDIFNSINNISSASLVLYDGDASKQEFEISSGDILIPGAEIQIEGGYSNEEAVLFKGIITSQKVKLKRRGDTLLMIECKDAAYKMTLSRRSKYFKQSTDSDVFEEIVSGYPDMIINAESTSEQHEEVVQYQVSDWDFVVSRAERLGMVCITDNGTLKIQKPDLSASPVLEVAYGSGVFDADLEIDGRFQYGKVSATSWDAANQDLLTSEVTDADMPAQGNIDSPTLASDVGGESVELRHSGMLSQQDIDAWAYAQLLKANFSKIRGTIKFQGTDQVRCGDLIEVGGFGDRFNGSAFVSGVQNTLGDGDWESTVQLGLDPKWHFERFPINEPACAGFSPSISGLQIGVVTQLQDDPAGEERIRIRIPVISPDDEGIWTRIASLDAGDDRGMVMRPEIGDEVIVGFVNQDPNEAIMLGMLHSSNKPSPIPASDENNEKGLKTRSGMQIIFNDDETTLLIDTPNGNKVLLSDNDGAITIEDENGNIVKMESGGVTMESPSDINITATGDVNIEGMNVNVSASANLSIEGSAGAKLSSSGVTEVKGSLLQLN